MIQTMKPLFTKKTVAVYIPGPFWQAKDYTGHMGNDTYYVE